MPREDNQKEERDFFILTKEKADCLVREALDTDPCEPEAFVRLLLLLLDRAEEPRLKEAIHELIKAAYDSSILHSIHLDEYIDAVRQRQNIVEEARARWLNRQNR